MTIKFTIEDATPQELAQLMHNLNQMETGSTTTVKTKTRNLNLSDKGPAQQAEPETQADPEADPAIEQDQLENEGAKEAPAAEVKKDDKKKTDKATAPRGNRKTNAQVEAETKSAPAESSRSRRDEEEGDSEEEERRHTSPAGNLIEKLAELADKFVGLYKTDEAGNKALVKRLIPYGVTNISEVAPADRTAVIFMLEEELKKP